MHEEAEENEAGRAGEGQTFGVCEAPIDLSAKDFRSSSSGCGEVRLFARMSAISEQGFRWLGGAEVGGKDPAGDQDGRL